MIDGSEGETEFEKWHIVRIVNFCWMLLVHESGSSRYQEYLINVLMLHLIVLI